MTRVEISILLAIGFAAVGLYAGTTLSKYCFLLYLTIMPMFWHWLFEAKDKVGNEHTEN